MSEITGDLFGASHVISSILSLIAGTIILSIKKGTLLHKRIGYLYVVSMTFTNLSAFLIYRLTGTFGFFHIAASLSLLTIYSGMIPIWRKKPINKWKYYHLTFMYWSVIGLYMALVAEILTRLPNTNFSLMVFISMALVSIIGAINFRVNKVRWKKY